MAASEQRTAANDRLALQVAVSYGGRWDILNAVRGLAQRCAGGELRAADISKGWCIQAWGDPQTRFTFGLRDIGSQLDRLQLIMLHVAQTSRKIATANLMPERNTPVTFVGDPPPAAPVPEVVGKKSRP